MVRVYAFLWFDVEDYVTPESDVAVGRLVDVFERHGLRATFKMVGEKVRGLQRRGHHDILARLRGQDIGYHTDYHSRPPSISEYELGCSWEEGSAEFIRREQAGLDALKQAFGRGPSCYGQPGGSWAPQVYGALRQWGIPVYLDAGPWVRLGGRPHRYCDVLDMLGLDGTMHIGIGGGAGAVLECQARLAKLVDRMRHTGGEISLYAHECEFVAARFWDAVNYARGEDTPRDAWQAAPLVPDEEREARYRAMDGFLAFLRALPEVEVVIASQAPTIYMDRARGRAFTPQQIGEVCANMADAVTHQQCDGAWLSPAEVLGLAVRLLAIRGRTGEWPDQVTYRYLDGPSEPSASEIVTERISPSDVFGTCLYEDAWMNTHRRLPAEIQVGRNWFAPGDFLATIGAALPRWLEGDVTDAPLVAADLAAEAYIPDHVSWDWGVFPPDFNADPLLAMARLQAWTLKPAPITG